MKEFTVTFSPAFSNSCLWVLVGLMVNPNQANYGHVSALLSTSSWTKTDFKYRIVNNISGSGSIQPNISYIAYESWHQPVKLRED